MSGDRRSADVVIAGAGITGWILAALLANQNLSVVVLEQRYQRPRDGSFAGVVTDSDFDALGLGRPPAARLQPLESVVDINLDTRGVPSTQEVSGTFAVRHHDLLTWLQTRALHSGVIFERAATVTELRWHGGAVAGVVAGADATEWNARVVVLADESDPRLAEEPGLRPDWSPAQLMHTARQRFEGTHPLSDYATVHEQRHHDRVDAGPGRNVPEFAAVFSGRTTWGQAGFGTLVPCGNTSTLTVAMLLEDEMTSTRHIKEFMNEVLAHPAIAPAIESLAPAAFVTEVIPIGGTAHPHRFSGDGVLVLGDVVGLTHPLNRDGLSSNVDVAKVAAETIVDSGRTGDFSSIALSRYDERVRELVIEPLRSCAEAESLPADVAWSVSTRFLPLTAVAHAYHVADSVEARLHRAGQRPVSLRKRLTGLGQRIRHGD
ncbi:MAG: hypothetical protein M3440_15485 [Chloroflexota bacterium]|nr:hypothetical protein [Chloroflexota bacterium]